MEEGDQMATLKEEVERLNRAKDALVEDIRKDSWLLGSVLKLALLGVEKWENFKKVIS